MIKRLQNKAENIECFEWSDTSSPYFLINLEMVGNSCSIHIEVTRWSHNVLKQARVDWIEFKKYIDSKGIKQIVLSYPDIDENQWWVKFIKLFGFDEPKRVMISTMEI